MICQPQLIDSDHTDSVSVHCIDSKCKVYDLDEYLELGPIKTEPPAKKMKKNVEDRTRGVVLPVKNFASGRW